LRRSDKESKKKRKIWPWILLAVLAVLLIAAIRSHRQDPRGQRYPPLTKTYTVARGSVSSTNNGSGKLESAGTEDIDVPDGVHRFGGPC
jgi:hypothetical protein